MVQTRYQNALLYGPGMAIGPHPERTAATLPTLQVSQPDALRFAAMDAGAPAVSSYGTSASAAAASPLSIGAAGAAAGISLAPMAVKGAVKAADYLTKNPDTIPDALNSIGAIPQVTYGGSEFGLVPAAENPFNTDLVWAPNGLDLGVGDAGFYGNGGMANAPSPTTAADVAAAYDVPVPDYSTLPAGGFDLAGAGINMGAGALGSWGGSTLAKGLVEGDQQDQGINAGIGGTIGGAIGSIFGPLGTLAGSFIGSLAAGTLAPGEPDIPYSYAGLGGRYDFNDPNAAPTFGALGGGAMNHGSPTAGTALGNSLADYLNGRAAAEGYVWNPEKVNDGTFSVGTWGKDQYFYQPYLNGAHGGAVLADGRETPDYLFSNPMQVADRAWGDLTSNGYFAKPGTFASWGDVLNDLNTDPMWNVQFGQPNSGESGDQSTNPWAAPMDMRTYQATPKYQAWQAQNAADMAPALLQSGVGGN